MDNTVDISHMTDEEYEAYMDKLEEEIGTCPCANCTDNCREMGMVSVCKRYRKWRRRIMGIRD